MHAYSEQTRLALTRREYSQEAVWRDTGNFALHVFVIDGPIDAPEYSPAGGMRATNYGPGMRYVHRPGVKYARP
jgi:hypothetical protein